MTVAPTVSAIVPVRDGETFVAEAIESILRQTRPVHEVVVVDDGSSDGSADIAVGFGPPVRVVGQPQLNLSEALNRGIAEATGALLAFCDADDLWPADKLERQLRVLERDPDVLLVSGLVQEFVSPGAEEVARGLRIELEPQTGPLTGTLLMRRAAVEQVGLFNTEHHLAAGVEWIARVRSSGVRMETVDAVVLLRRVHGANMSIVHRAEKERDLLAMARAHRRRVHGSVPGG